MCLLLTFIISHSFLQASKKKVYMLYDLEPDRSVTGGAWYCDQDFEAEFVDVLNQQCYRYLQQKLEATKDCKGGPIAAQNSSYASSKDVWKYISELGISKVITSVLAYVFISTGFVISRWQSSICNSPYENLLSNVIFLSNLQWYHFRIFCLWSWVLRLKVVSLWKSIFFSVVRLYIK